MGKLGDDEKWFEWLFVYETYNKIINLYSKPPAVLV